jgi:hypothetical protein
MLHYTPQVTTKPTAPARSGQAGRRGTRLLVAGRTHLEVQLKSSLYAAKRRDKEAAR